MDKVRIIHVYKSFNVYNGLIEILQILAQNIDHDRYEFSVAVFEYEKNSFGEMFEKSGGKIINLNLHQNAFTEYQYILALKKLFTAYKPHIVQTHVLKANLYGTLAAKMAQVPVVVATEMTLKDIAPTAAKRFRDRLVQPIVGYIIDNCDRFMVTSEFIKREWMNSANQNRFEVIYPPFNLDKYDKAVRIPRTDIQSVGRNIGFVGRLSEEKSVDILLEAIAIVKEQYPDIMLTVVGTGEMEGQLKKHAELLGITDNVRFTGYCQNSFEVLKEIDVFVLPSRTEGCPIVILEAMAMGLPVIATRVGGNPELVEDNITGFLVSHGRPDQIAEGIKKLIEDRDMARVMGQNGRKRAFTQFHPSTFTDKLQSLYLQLLDMNGY